MKMLLMIFRIIVAAVLAALLFVQGAGAFNIMTENYPPYSYEKDGEPAGFSTDIVKEIMKRVGVRDKIRGVTWAGAYNAILSLDNQILFSMARTEEREGLFKWAGPIASYRVVIWARKADGIKISSLEQAKKAGLIGVSINTSVCIYLQRLGFPNLDVVHENYLNPLKLASGRISLWVAAEHTGRYLTEQQGINPDLFESVFEVRKESLYIAFSKNIPDTDVLKWQKALDAAKSDGTYDRIAEKHGMNPDGSVMK